MVGSDSKTALDQGAIAAAKTDENESSELDFNTGIPELDRLLQEVYWLGEGKGGHESGFLFMDALEDVKHLIGDRNRLVDHQTVRATLCQIGTVAEKDGYELIRRDSMIDMIDRLRPPKA